MAGHLDELKTDRRPSERDAVAERKRKLFLTVEDEHGWGGGLAHGDCVYLIRRINDGTRRQRVRTDGSDNKRVELLTEDRTAGRQVVARRADRGANDQAVAAEPRNRFAIECQIEVNHMKRRAGPHDDFVKGEKRLPR